MVTGTCKICWMLAGGGRGWEAEEEEEEASGELPPPKLNIYRLFETE